MAVFVWTVQNYGKEDADVSIMFTFQSGEGKLNDVSYGHYNEPFTCKGIQSEVENGRTMKEGKFRIIMLFNLILNMNHQLAHRIKFISYNLERQATK